MRYLGENNIRTIHTPKEKDHKNTEACQGWIRPVGPGCIIDSMWVQQSIFRTDYKVYWDKVQRTYLDQHESWRWQNTASRQVITLISVVALYQTEHQNTWTPM